MEIAVYVFASGGLHVMCIRACEGLWKRNRVQEGDEGRRSLDAAAATGRVRAEDDAKRFLWLVTGWVFFAYLPTLLSSVYRGEFWSAFYWLTPFTAIYIAEALYVRSLLNAAPREPLAVPSEA